MQEQNEYEIRAGKAIVYAGNDIEQARRAFFAAAKDPAYFSCKIDFLYRGEVVTGFGVRIGYQQSEANEQQTDS